MLNRIQEHHNDEEIEIIRLQNEIIQWKSELKFISQEINFFLELIKSEIFKNNSKTYVETELLWKEFQNLKEISYKFSKRCDVFQPKLNEKKECEDIQCDHAYLNEHLSLRQKIDKHMSAVRHNKQLAFEYIRNGIKKNLN